jgi:hypothetical protein
MRYGKLMIWSLMVAGMSVLVWRLPILAQESKEEAEKAPAKMIGQPDRSWGSRVIEVKFADVESLAQILRPFGNVTPNRDLRVLTISGNAASLTAMEETIKRFDVPPPVTRNLEITAYLLAGGDSPGGMKLPPELESVGKQIKMVFPFPVFSLMDTLVIRCREGRRAEVKGVAPSPDQESRKTFYNLDFAGARLVPEGAGRLIRIDGLRLGAKIPIDMTMPNTPPQVQYIDTGISTDVDVREGQKVVVGKSTVDGSNNAIFLILSAKVME